ncbi:MAG: 6-carboxytetrahydropterin synthase [Planctomycetota bacterium]
MLALSRAVRFCLADAPSDTTPARSNTFSAWPPPAWLDRYYELTVTCHGEADPLTGYFINIKHIDTAVREHALPVLRDAIALAPADRPPLAELMHRVADALQPPLNDSVATLDLALTPFVRLLLHTNHMQQVFLKQRYSFSAAHRLHVPSYSDQENRETFGKCNNPAGHGHNYHLEVVARCPVDDHGQSLSVAALDDAVDEHVIEALDHKHLNEDVAAYADHNPSVEHIAADIWDRLAGHMPGPATLDEVTVWETEKTACTYRGPVPAPTPA